MAEHKGMEHDDTFIETEEGRLLLITCTMALASYMGLPSQHAPTSSRSSCGHYEAIASTDCVDMPTKLYRSS